MTLIADSLASVSLTPDAVTALATVDTKAAEPGLAEAARRLGVPLLTYPAAVLAAVSVPHPSHAPLAAAGTPSVAEAAALTAAGGPGPAELVVGKRKSLPGARATCAVARARTTSHRTEERP
ncbi:cobyrinic acid a,c-diamide synthase [Streptomyces rimosus subsp. rimosus]|nr:cobyrinic acid a,c-diamide synthase [Streptomyces rimosus subsp. rimosus]